MRILIATDRSGAEAGSCTSENLEAKKQKRKLEVITEAGRSDLEVKAGAGSGS